MGAEGIESHMILYFIFGFVFAGYAKKKGYLDGLTNVGVIVNFVAFIVAWPLYALVWIAQRVSGL